MPIFTSSLIAVGELIIEFTLNNNLEYCNLFESESESASDTTPTNIQEEEQHNLIYFKSEFSTIKEAVLNYSKNQCFRNKIVLQVTTPPPEILQV